ncbi:MAG: hypothetical protein BJ554DRAFT_1323, partial [Olpidium bornovanus]
HEERQVAIEALWSTRLYVPSTQTEQTRLAELYEKAGFYRVLEKIYRQEGRYDLVMESYLADKGRRESVFDAVAELMGSSPSGFRLSDAQKAQVRNAAMARLPDLVGIDGWRSAELVKNHLEVPHAEALARLSPDAEKQASLLRGLLEACKFEETFLGITNALVGRDLFEMVRAVVQGRAKGWRPRRGQCAACRKTLWTNAPSFGTQTADSRDEESRSLVVFRCGHGYLLAPAALPGQKFRLLLLGYLVCDRDVYGRRFGSGIKGAGGKILHKGQGRANIRTEKFGTKLWWGKGGKRDKDVNRRHKARIGFLPFNVGLRAFTARPETAQFGNHILRRGSVPASAGAPARPFRPVFGSFSRGKNTRGGQSVPIPVVFTGCFRQI